MATATQQPETQQVETGLYDGISFDDYCALDAVNQSALKQGEESMAHMKAALDRDVTVTDDMRQGSALHLIALEPHEIPGRLAVWKGKTRRGSEWNDFQQQHDGKIILTENAWSDVKPMLDSMRRHPIVRDLMSWDGRPEVTAVWRHEETDVLCKSRFDYLVELGSPNPSATIVDIKKTRSANPRRFAMSAEDYGYPFQAAFYCRGYFALIGVNPRFVLVAVENKPPYDCSVYEYEPSDLDDAWSRAEDLLAQYVHCKKNNVWPGRHQKRIQTLVRPAWATNEHETLMIEGRPYTY